MGKFVFLSIKPPQEYFFSGPKSCCLVELLSTIVFCPKFLFGAFFFSKFGLSFAISILPCRAALHFIFFTFHLPKFLLPEHHLHQCNRFSSFEQKHYFLRLFPVKFMSLSLHQVQEHQHRKDFSPM